MLRARVSDDTGVIKNLEGYKERAAADLLANKNEIKELTERLEQANRELEAAKR